MSENRPLLPPASTLRRRWVNRSAWLWLIPAACLLFWLVCALATGAFAPDAPAPEAAPQAEAALQQLAPQGAGAPVAVSVMTGEERYELSQSADGFALAGESTAIDERAAKALLGCGSSVLARRRVSGDPAAFGLGEDALQAVFTYENGDTWTLRLGSAVATGEGCYAAVPGDDGAYIVNTALRATLTAGRNALYALPDLDERFTAQTLMTVRVSRPGAQAVSLARVTAENAHNTVVELTEPIRYPANAERAAELFLALDELAPIGVAAIDGADADWGLSEPLAELTLAAESALRLRIGRTESALTLRIDDEPTVYLLPDGAADFLQTVTVPYLLEQLPGLVALNRVSRLTVTAGEERYDITVSRADGGDAYAINGTPVERERFTALYQALIGLLVERYQPDAQPAGEARVAFDYELTGGDTFRLAFLPCDDAYDIVQRGDCACLLISRAKVDAAVAQIKQCVEESSLE